VNLDPPTEHQLLGFWVALAVIVVAARLLGLVAQRLGEPAVVGESAAGLLLGPSVLDKVAPDVSDWMFPADDGLFPRHTVQQVLDGCDGTMILAAIHESVRVDS
jgi:Kef-type K+ transport system membrane component KefB